MKSMLTKLFYAFISVSSLFALLGVQPAYAANMTVTTNVDEITTNGLCSLREAITNANNDAATYPDCPAGAGADVITFAGNYTITLGSQLPTITTTMTITGTGEANTIVQASTCNPVTLPGGCTPAVYGVLYLSSGNLTLTDLTVRHGFAEFFVGGGMYNSGGTATLTNMTFSGNSASTNGGGMYNGNIATLTNVTFSGNTSGNSGGGMFNGSTATLTNVTFSANSTTDSGGGMSNYNPATLTNVIFSGNTSGRYGGGMYNQGSSPTLTNVTFSGNTASSQGGGMYNLGSSSSSPTLKNVIIANSTGGGDCINSGGSTLNASSSNNLIEDTGSSACGLTNGVSNNIIGSDPNLGPLANNGGSTQTHALLAGSPAIDTGTNTGCPATDQRGVTRPQNSTCDIGAYELIPQEMDLRDNADTLGIADGDLTPDVADGTDMGSTPVGGSGVSSAFRIENNGAANLTLTIPFTIGGANPGDFSVTSAASSPVTADSFTNFTVRCIPSAAGIRTADISIANNDSDENPYNFRVQCEGVDPEMDLRDNADTLGIADGDVTPDVSDGTDMGSTLVSGSGVTSAFRIENNGTANLTLTIPFTIGGANPADFSVTSGASSPVTANNFTNFTVQCIPSAAGIRTADISIANNDADENPYNFRMQCEGINHPTLDKSFSPNVIVAGGTSTLTFTLTNPNSGAALTNLNFTDSLPAGMEIAATPNIGGTCNSNNVLAAHFTPNLAAAGTAINLVSGSAYDLAASASCTITVDVTATTTDSMINTSGAIGSTETGVGTDNASDTLTVGNGPVVIYGANTIPSDGATLTTGPTQIFVEFNKDLNPTTAQDTNNYMLIEEGTTAGFQTVDCATGVDANDTQITVNSASYSNAGSLYLSTLGINGGAALPVGSYRLYVCGTTSIEDTIGIELNDGLSDSLLDFTIVTAPAPAASSLPDTGFAPNRITSLSAQPANLAYNNLGSIWMEIPSLNVKTEIVGVPQSAEGWNVDWLNQSAGWLNGTAFPSWEGNSVVTAHVYDSNGLPGPFQKIKNLKSEDKVIVHMYGEQYIFEVRDSSMVFPSSTKSALEHLEGHSYLTLITCQWYNPVTDSYVFRRVVRAVLISVQAE